MARIGLLCLVLVLGAAKFLHVVHGHYPIQHWLFFRYLSHWFWVGFLALACWSSGSAVLGWLRILFPRAERTLMAFVVGFYLFFLCMFLGGVLHLLGRVFSIALPLSLILMGVPRAMRRRRLLRPLSNFVRGPVRMRSWLTVVICLFGVGGFLLIYIPTLSPQNIAADARWYHIVMAESYAAGGGIGRSHEGSFVAAYPQLATVVYSWAFILPRTTLFDRLEIAAHIEVMVFIWTLLGVAVLAARVIPRRKIGLTWTAIFLFPGIFLYDSNLSVAADHILAFWAPPIFLCLLRAFERLDFRRCLLFAIPVSGAALTKYQAGCLVLVPIAVLVVRAVWLSIRRSGSRVAPLGGAALAGALTLLLTAPHWAKNALWYHDPFYPLLHTRLPVQPWSPDAKTYFDTIFRAAFWQPEGTFGTQLKETLVALFTFSFENHDWVRFHGAVPVFGSLFTLTTLALPFLGGGRRLWGLVGCTYAGVFIWFWASHQDRYLQAIVPWMAAATAALIVHIWQTGMLARACVSLLILAQVVWGGDVPFIPTHAFVKTTPFKYTLDLVATGYQGEYFERLRPFPPWLELGRKLPKDAKVLVHGDIGPLGLGRPSVTDLTGWQGGISYARHSSPRELHQHLVKMGVTHVVWTPDWGHAWNSVADDLVFYSFVARQVGARDAVARHQFAKLLAEPPPDSKYGLVLVWGKVEGYESGLYPLSSLTVPGWKAKNPWKYPTPQRAAHGDEDTLLPEAEFVVVGADKHPTLTGLSRIMTRNKTAHIWQRAAR